MSDIGEMLASWDGSSDPPQEVLDHLKSLGGQVPEDEKLKNYLLGDEQNQKVS